MEGRYDSLVSPLPRLPPVPLPKSPTCMQSSLFQLQKLLLGSPSAQCFSLYILSPSRHLHTDLCKVGQSKSIWGLFLTSFRGLLPCFTPCGWSHSDRPIGRSWGGHPRPTTLQRLCFVPQPSICTAPICGFGPSWRRPSS